MSGRRRDAAGTRTDILVAEDVRGPALDALAPRFRIERDEDLWMDPGALRRRLQGVRALVVRNRTQVDRLLLESGPDLVVVARAGAGLDNVDVAAADELGIVVVAAVGGENARSVAELALGLAIALARRIVDLDRDVRHGGWDRSPGLELAGRAWGLVGLGRTGLATGELARGIGMDVVGYDPFVRAGDPRLDAAGIRRLGLNELRRAADVLSIHVALDTSTRNLVDEGFITGMRKGALLINVSRGETLDEEAVAAAIRRGHLGGAALDVRTTEPSGVGVFAGLDRVILTPHVGGLTEAAQERVTSALAEELDRVLRGLPARAPAGRTANAR
ncbi:MAG: phosphoglycerate dehydrogenase [Chloroflexi bacterium]|nr:phosphoglycerate dehydrogenase [Chloroflexota bacterium]